MFFHEETDIEKISTKVTVDWNITAETLDEPDKLSESYQAILSFQDFTDFFDDLKEKQRKVMQAHSFTAENQKYLALNMLHVETEDNFYAPARITIVDFDRNLVYDKIVNPGSKVLNIRDCGLTQEDLEAGSSIEETQVELEELFKDKCIVGHNLSQFIFNFRRPDESLDLAFYNQLHFLLMAITKVRYSGMMSISDMSNFLLGDRMDDVKSSDNLRYAQTIMQIFYFAVETLQKEATNQRFGVENAAREEPFELKEASTPKEPKHVKVITPKEYYKMIQMGTYKSYRMKRMIKVDWKLQ